MGRRNVANVESAGAQGKDENDGRREPRMHTQDRTRFAVHEIARSWAKQSFNPPALSLAHPPAQNGRLNRCGVQRTASPYPQIATCSASFLRRTLKGFGSGASTVTVLPSAPGNAMRARCRQSSP